MKSAKVFLSVALFFFFSLTTAKLHAEENVPEDTLDLYTGFQNNSSAEAKKELTAIDRIEVGVESCKIRVFQETEDSLITESYPAGTATPGKNSKGIPYDKVATIWKIVFWPTWTPTKDIKNDYFKKTGKQMKDCYPPGKGNPLGFVKIFMKYDGCNSALGIHDTNEQQSVGHRVSHGCTRMHRKDATELARHILLQNGYDADEIIRQAKLHPGKTVSYPIKNGPKVIYRRK